MKRTRFLTIVAVVSILYGLGFLIVPAQVSAWHDMAPSPDVDLVSRLHAAYLIGFGVTAWLARDAADSDGLLAIMRGGLVISVLVFLVALSATVTGQINAMGWAPTILAALIGLGFWYYGFSRRAPV